MRFMAVLALAAAACGEETRTVADGTIVEWLELGTMPVARANHCSAYVGDQLLVIGGNYRPEGSADFVRLDAVHGAVVKDDGSLGEWAQVGTLPSAVTECTAAAKGDRLFILDGLWDTDTHEARVWTAVLEDGALGAFVELAPLPTGRRVLSSEAWVTGDDVLIAMGGSLPDEDDMIFALRAPLEGDALGEWSEDDWHPGWRGAAQHAFDGEHVFTLGGYLGASMSNAVTDAVTRGDLGDDGAITGAASETPLPAPIAFGEAVAVDDWVFLVGGRPAIFGAQAQLTVWSAPIEDGALGAWTTQAALPVGRTNHELVVARDWLYLTGGGNEGPGLATVFSAVVRAGP